VKRSSIAAERILNTLGKRRAHYLSRPRLREGSVELRDVMLDGEFDQAGYVINT